MKHVVLLSGGHSSALVAVNVVAKHGKDNVILLNHNISSFSESADIKRFKRQVADYLELPITYANINGIQNADELPDQFDVCIEAGALTDNAGNALCTSRLKTEPFNQWLAVNLPRGNDMFRNEEECVIYYGFDILEQNRITRRVGIMASKGYRCDFPMATWNARVTDIKQVGILPPAEYSVFKHANCIGCLKASLLHWYVTYVHYRKSYNKGIAMEDAIDFSIHTIIRNKVKRPISLAELQPIFQRMLNDNIPATEHQSAHGFARLLRTYELEEGNAGIPCECITN